MIADEDKKYFRESREAKIGMTLEEFSKKAPQALIQLQQQLSPIREMLTSQPYLAGESPTYADICLLSTRRGIAGINDTPFLEKGDILQSWYQRMLKNYPDASRAVSA